MILSYATLKKQHFYGAHILFYDSIVTSLMIEKEMTRKVALSRDTLTHICLMDFLILIN